MKTGKEFLSPDLRDESFFLYKHKLHNCFVFSEGVYISFFFLGVVIVLDCCRVLTSLIFGVGSRPRSSA